MSLLYPDRPTLKPGTGNKPLTSSPLVQNTPPPSAPQPLSLVTSSRAGRPSGGTAAEVLSRDEDNFRRLGTANRRPHPEHDRASAAGDLLYPDRPATQARLATSQAQSRSPPPPPPPPPPLQPPPPQVQMPQVQMPSKLLCSPPIEQSEVSILDNTTGHVTHGTVDRQTGAPATRRELQHQLKQQQRQQRLQQQQQQQQQPQQPQQPQQQQQQRPPSSRGQQRPPSRGQQPLSRGQQPLSRGRPPSSSGPPPRSGLFSSAGRGDVGGNGTAPSPAPPASGGMQSQAHHEPRSSEADEEIAALRTQVAALTSMLHQGVRVDMEELLVATTDAKEGSSLHVCCDGAGWRWRFLADAT
jgi:hypothetical protein